MRQLEKNRHGFLGRCGPVALTLLISWAGRSPAAPLPGDPVEPLRQVLAATVASPDQLAFRKEGLQKGIDALRTIGDYRRALQLQDWRDDSIEPGLAAVDKEVRTELVRRFERALRREMEGGTVAGRLAAVNLVGDMGLTGRGVLLRLGETTTLGRDVANRTRDADGAVRAAAGLALGRMFADVKIAVPALRGLVTAPEERERRAALEGLEELIRVGAQQSRSGTSAIIKVEEREVAAVAAAVVPAAALALNDPVAAVRRRAAATLHLTGVMLSDFIKDPDPRDKFPPQGQPLTPADREVIKEYVERVHREQADLLPLVEALRGQTAILARASADPDPSVRILARKALEEVALSRLRMLRKAASVSSLPREKEAARASRPFPFPRRDRLVARLEQAPAASPEDLLLTSLEHVLPALVRGLNDPSPRARLASLDALEVLGEQARPVAPSVVASLGDPNHFVRWAAARTLGRMAPAAAEMAVPRLARQLSDTDLDLQLAAARALQEYGPAALPALPALIEALGRSDAEMRIEVIDTILAVGTEADAAFPALAEALAHPDARVRRSAAEALGRFGPPARAAASAALRRALDDEDEETRRRASDALLAINPLPQDGGK